MGSQVYPLVSIVIPVYKGEKYIAQSVKSLLDQTMESLEIILVDDCSPDKSVEIVQDIIKEYSDSKKKVRIIRQAVNGGVAKAREIGVKEASGEFIILIDRDDWYLPEALEVMYQEAKLREADVVVCDYQVVNEKGLPINVMRCSEWTDDVRTSLKNYILSSLVHHWCFLVKREVWERLEKDKLGELNRTSNLGLRLGEDQHLMLRLLYFANKVVNVHIPFYQYRESEVQVTNNLTEQHVKDNIRAFQDLISFYEEKESDSEYNKLLIWRLQTWMANLIYIHKDAWLRLFPKEFYSYLWENPKLKKRFKIMLSEYHYSLHFMRPCAWGYNMLRKISRGQ